MVDDDPINHLVIEGYLKEVAWTQHSKAMNGLEAIEIISAMAQKNIYFDLILMDCNMPIMDGFQATEEIKRMVSRKLLPSIRIIALTANVSASDRGECLRRGMDEVWTKPIGKQEFLRLLTIKCSEGHLN